MTKFKCKKCNKMVVIVSEQKEQRCSQCETTYEYIYDRGWHYDIKGYRTKKCVYCKNNIFVPVSQNNKGEVLDKIECSQCHKRNMTYWQYNLCELVPCDTLITPCAWCNEQLEINISQTTNKWINSGEGQYQKNTITCPHCKKKFTLTFGVGYGHPIYIVHSDRLFIRGRKKKATAMMIYDFLDNNSIYQSYRIVHPYNVVEYCEQSHIDEDSFFILLDDMHLEVFNDIDLKDIDISLYESEFSKLKLKESAMPEAGGASLSGLLGKNKAWTDLRKEVLEANDCTCEICGYKAPCENTKALHVHEEWEQEQNVVTLKKVSLICSRCHACKHVNQFVAYRVMEGQDELVEGIPRIDLITIHLMRVNKVSKEVIYAYRKKLHIFWNETQEEKSNKFVTSKENDMTYKYRIETSIPNYAAIIKVLQKRGLYQDS